MAIKLLIPLKRIAVKPSHFAKLRYMEKPMGISPKIKNPIKLGKIKE
jgi:hypothetical protein